MLTEFITWTANPALYDGFIEIRWYGLFFAIGFIVGYNMMERMFCHEQVNLKWLDSLFIYVVIATVLGARLGHCLFYAWDYYSQHPLEILKVWEGGLASHGGAIGIIIAIWLYSRRVTHRNMLWTFDRLVVPVALVAALIRTGNLMNHEIYGHVTTLPWGFRFIQNLSEWMLLLFLRNRRTLPRFMRLCVICFCSDCFCICIGNVMRRNGRVLFSGPF